MDGQLIKNWNQLVGHEDTVIHLGDFCFGDVKQWEKYRNQLNGKIILIKGNHDKLQNGQIDHLFEEIYDYLEIKVKDENAELTFLYKNVFFIERRGFRLLPAQADA